jgi:hypothetical protein
MGNAGVAVPIWLLGSVGNHRRVVVMRSHDKWGRPFRVDRAKMCLKVQNSTFHRYMSPPKPIPNPSILPRNSGTLLGIIAYEAGVELCLIGIRDMGACACP